MNERLKETLGNEEWRLNNLFHITSRTSEKIKFTPNKAQLHFLENKGKRNIVLKSRRLGFTTLLRLKYGLDNVLFNRNYHSLFIAHDQDSAWDIFQTVIEFAWLNLPLEVRALYKLDASNANTLRFGFGDGSFSSTKVRTSGRSGGYQDLHISEFAKTCLRNPSKAKEIISGSIPSIPLNGDINIESTAEGDEGYFYDMFTEAWHNPPKHATEYKAFFYNWRWDTEEIAKVTTIEKNIPKDILEVKKEHKLTDIETTYYYLKYKELNQNFYLLRQEYPTTWTDAFATTTEGAFYTNEINEVYNSKRISESTLYDPNYLVDTWWDIGMNHPTIIWFTQDIGNDVRVLECYVQTGEGLDGAIKDLRAKPYKYSSHNAPHDIEVREWTRGGVSRYEVAAKKGIIFQKVPNISVEDGIEATRQILKRCVFDKNGCELGLKMLRNYKREWDDNRGKWKNNPKDDEATDFADAFRYMAVGHSKNSSDKNKYNQSYVTLDSLNNY